MPPRYVQGIDCPIRYDINLRTLGSKSPTFADLNGVRIVGEFTVREDPDAAVL